MPKYYPIVVSKLTKRERRRKYSEDCPAFSIAAPPRTVKRSVIKNRIGCCSPEHLQNEKNEKFSFVDFKIQILDIRTHISLVYIIT